MPFDVERLTITGAAVPALAGVRRRAAVHLAVSQTGTLAYIPGPVATVETAVSLVIGDGREAPVVLGLPAAFYEHPRVSPDGRMLAVGRTDGMDRNVWIYDLSGNSALRRLTYGRTDRFPVWSADGRRVTFQSGPQGDRAIWWQPIDGGPAQRLTRPAEGEEHAPEAWSRDGRRLLFSVTKASKNFLWVLTLDDGKTEPVGTIQSAEPLSASFSPDGRWVAYSRHITHPFGDPRFFFVYARNADGSDLTAPIACRSFEQYRRKGWTAVKVMLDAPRELQGPRHEAHRMRGTAEASADLRRDRVRIKLKKENHNGTSQRQVHGC